MPVWGRHGALTIRGGVGLWFAHAGPGRHEALPLWGSGAGPGRYEALPLRGFIRFFYILFAFLRLFSGVLFRSWALLL